MITQKHSECVNGACVHWVPVSAERVMASLGDSKVGEQDGVPQGLWLCAMGTLSIY